MKQETLEEASSRCAIQENKSSLYELGMKYFQLGAKWQQERSYSEAEFLTFSEWVSSKDWVYLPSKGYWVNEEQEELEQKFTTKQLFEQFKKK